MFEQITAAPADPILGLTDAFNNDERTHKINLGVGVYKDENGQTPVLKSVKKAEAYLLENEPTKSYLAISGVKEYGIEVQKLLLGELYADMQTRFVSAQTPGGTGGLRVAAEFLVRQAGAKRIWVSAPSWPNHGPVFKAAGLEVLDYAYYDSVTKSLDFKSASEDLQAVQPGDVVLLHGCCHNPTGIDPDAEQWQQLADLLKQKKALPLFDFAYQGFGNGLDEDAVGLRTFAKQFDELVVSSSFSKNFGLYNERVGAVSLLAKEPQVAQDAFSQLKAIIRGLYSNPPAHGAKVVAHILTTPELRAEWVEELAAMRARIKKMRELFVKTLRDKGVAEDFSFIARQNGMFSFSGLQAHQVARLREEFAVYIVGSGRINVAGMTEGNMDALCSAIAEVL